MMNKNKSWRGGENGQRGWRGAVGVGVGEGVEARGDAISTITGVSRHCSPPVLRAATLDSIGTYVSDW